MLFERNYINAMLVVGLGPEHQMFRHHENEQLETI
jgi:hypothetical protein